MINLERLVFNIIVLSLFLFGVFLKWKNLFFNIEDDSIKQITIGFISFSIAHIIVLISTAIWFVSIQIF